MMVGSRPVRTQMHQAFVADPDFAFRNSSQYDLNT
jgi:hypothetical protein